MALYVPFMTVVIGLAIAFYALVLWDEHEKRKNEAAVYAARRRENKYEYAMHVVDDVRSRYGSQQTYEVWRFRWKWDSVERYYWKSGEKFYRLNGKEGPEDFTEDDVLVNAYDDEVYTIKYVKGPSRWEIATQSDGKTIVRMIG